MTRHVRVGLVAALATVAVGAAMSPLLEGRGWVVSMIAVVGGVAGVGMVSRWLRAPAALTLALQLLTVLWVACVAGTPQSLLLGVLPGPEATARLGDLILEGGRAINEYAVPAPQTAGLTALLVVGLGVVAAVVDTLAVTFRQVALAGLPLLAVYCVPAALVPGGLSWVWFVLAGAAFLLLLASDTGEAMRRWGRALGGAGREGGTSAATGRAARALGAAAIAIAAIVPSMLPDLPDRLLADGLGGGDGGPGTINVVNPILSLRDNLGERSDRVVISYETDQPAPAPLRIVTTDQFDGETWSPSTGSIPRDQRPQEGLPSAPGLSADVPVVARTTTITIDDLAQTYLPLPYPATRIDELEGDWLFEAETLNVVGDGTTTENTRYVVRHQEVTPGIEQLQAAGSPPPALVERYTSLPDDLPASVAEQAADIAGDGSAYDQAVALQDWFREDGGFTYSETVESGSGSDAVATFLADKNGFCVQFSSAMAVMARTLDIPSRVAVGFLPGTEQTDGSYDIALRDAHAWPELYFDGVGWVRFEPTPASRAGGPPAWAVPPATQPSDSPTTARPTTTAPRPTASTPAGQGATSSEVSDGTAGLGVDVPWRLVLVVLLVVVVLGSPATLSAITRRHRRSGATDPSQAAEVAWSELVERADDLGFVVPPASTVRQQVRWLTAAGGLGTRPARTLTALGLAVEQARYSPDGAGSAPTRQQVDAVVSQLSTAAGRRRAIGARIFPRSAFRTAGRGVRSVEQRGDEVGAAVTDAGRRIIDRVGPSHKN